MKAKKFIESHIRGWLPKELSTAGLQVGFTAYKQGLVISAFGMGVSELVLWTAFLLGLYKNQMLFFATQAVIISVDVSLLALVYLLGRHFAKRNTELPNRGWLPKEPNTFGIDKAAGQKKLLNKRGIVAFSSVLLCGIIAAGFFIVPLLLYDGESTDDGWVAQRVIERVGFPGGDIVVWKFSESSRDKGYIILDVEPNVTTREKLSAYIDSRTKTLNQLLKDTNSIFEAIVTFKASMSPEEFGDWLDSSVEKSGDNAEIRSGIIAVECYLQPDQARNLQSDPDVLLVESVEDSQMRQIIERYQAEGFNAQVQRSLPKEMWKQYIALEGLL